MTAAHCGQTNYDPSTITVYWNRVSSCAAGLEDAESVSGPTTSGGTTRALYATGGINFEDQWLIELSGSVPAGSDAAFAGWDASNVTTMTGGGPANVFGINHGLAETKQYTASTLGPASVAGTFIHYDWTTGYTAKGSSGSGIFESTERLFGTGDAAGTDTNGDPMTEYQILAAGWHGDGGTNNPASSLSVWLDPQSTGTLGINGIAAVAAPSVSISASPDSVVSGSNFTVTWSSQSATSCSASGAWSGTQSPNGALQVTSTAAGSYTYTLTCTNTGGNTTDSATVVVTADSSSSSSGGSSSSGSNSGSGGGGGAISPFFLSVFAAAAMRGRRKRFCANEYRGRGR